MCRRGRSLLQITCVHPRGCGRRLLWLRQLVRSELSRGLHLAPPTRIALYIDDVGTACPDAHPYPPAGGEAWLEHSID